VRARCKQHGVVDGIEDRRWRLRCSIDGCRKLLAIRSSSTSPPVISEVVSAEAIPPAELVQDPDVRQHQKALLLVNYQRAIREALKPTDWEKRLSALDEQVDRIKERLDEVFDEIDGLRSEIDGDPAAGVRPRFVCKECGEAGWLEVRLRCSACGGEIWWGWQPEPK